MSYRPSISSFTPAKVVGERVRALRIEVGWSQKELVSRLRTKLRVVKRLEAGKSAPDIFFLAKVAFMLGVDVATLTHRLLPRLPKKRRAFAR
jgi:transcriptional regulator with XRE-family HTH domain